MVDGVLLVRLREIQVHGALQIGFSHLGRPFSYSLIEMMMLHRSSG